MIITLALIISGFFLIRILFWWRDSIDKPNKEKQLEKEKDIYDKGSPDIKEKIFKHWLELLLSSTRERFNLLPTIASLTVMFLVVASFNEKLIQMTQEFKNLLVVLIVLIPISMWFMYWYLRYKAIEGGKHLEKLLNIKRNSDDETVEEKIIERAPFYLLLFFTIIIIIVCFWILKTKIPIQIDPKIEI